MHTIIRLARNTDIPQIVRLWKDLMEFHERIDSFFNMSSDGESRFCSYLQPCIEPSQGRSPQVFVFIAEVLDNNHKPIIVGYIMGNVSTYPPVIELQKFGDITDICVSGNYRKQGIGRFLVDEAKKWYTDRGIKRIHIMAASGNSISLAFWKKMGFVPIMEQMYFNT